MEFKVNKRLSRNVEHLKSTPPSFKRLVQCIIVSDDVIATLCESVFKDSKLVNFFEIGFYHVEFGKLIKNWIFKNERSACSLVRLSSSLLMVGYTSHLGNLSNNGLIKGRDTFQIVKIFNMNKTNPEIVKGIKLSRLKTFFGYNNPNISNFDVKTGKIINNEKVVFSFKGNLVIFNHKVREEKKQLERLSKYEIHKGRIRCILIIKRGPNTFLLSSGNDLNLKVFDLNKKKLLKTIRSTTPVNSMVEYDNGKKLLCGSGGMGGMMRIIDYLSGQTLKSINYDVGSFVLLSQKYLMFVGWMSLKKIYLIDLENNTTISHSSDGKIKRPKNAYCNFNYKCTNGMFFLTKRNKIGVFSGIQIKKMGEKYFERSSYLEIFDNFLLRNQGLKDLLSSKNSKLYDTIIKTYTE